MVVQVQDVADQKPTWQTIPTSVTLDEETEVSFFLLIFISFTKKIWICQGKVFSLLTFQSYSIKYYRVHHRLPFRWKLSDPHTHLKLRTSRSHELMLILCSISQPCTHSSSSSVYLKKKTRTHTRSRSLQIHKTRTHLMLTPTIDLWRRVNVRTELVSLNTSGVNSLVTSGWCGHFSLQSLT